MIQLAAGMEEHSRCRGLGRRGALSPGSADTPPLATVRPGFSLEQWDPGMKSTSLENSSHHSGQSQESVVLGNGFPCAMG